MGRNQTDVLWFLYRRAGDGYASLADVVTNLWGTDPLWRSRDPKSGARNALKSLLRDGYVEKQHPSFFSANPNADLYRLTGRGKGLVCKWKAEAKL